MDVSKTKSSFYRRLYVAYLIDSGLASSVPALTEATGMPRRTAQDTIAALADLDIICEFEQEEGARNHAGRYRIREWGAIDRGGSSAICGRSKRCWSIPEICGASYDAIAGKPAPARDAPCANPAATQILQELACPR